VSNLRVPRHLAAAAKEDGRADWLETLPSLIADVAARWSLTLGEPFEPGGQTAWVAPATSPAHGDVVLKVAWRHMESESEADGLREWNGDGAVRLLDHESRPDTSLLLLERCAPGTLLATRPEQEQDVVVAGLLVRLWRVPAHPDRFGTLQEMCDFWADSFERKIAQDPGRIDASQARDGASLFRSLPASRPAARLLCTDLHAENVLSAEREPWLVIDPKPFVGDPTYDALQHMLNCEDRLRRDPRGLSRRMAGLLGLDHHRLEEWLYARCVVDSLGAPWLLEVARRLRP
jgi:streptomycin 6-kinase